MTNTTQKRTKGHPVGSDTRPIKMKSVGVARWRKSSQFPSPLDGEKSQNLQQPWWKMLKQQSNPATQSMTASVAQDQAPHPLLFHMKGAQIV